MRAAASSDGALSTRGGKHPSAVAGLTVPDELLDRVAELVAERVAAAIGASQEPWLTKEGAMAYLACPESRIYDLVRLKRVRHFKDGRRLLFRRSDLDDCLEEFDRA